MTHDSPTIERMAQAALEAHDPDALATFGDIKRAAEGEVPPGATDLFGLVVADNLLAWLRTDWLHLPTGSDPVSTDTAPEHVLRQAITDAVQGRLEELLGEALPDLDLDPFPDPVVRQPDGEQTDVRPFGPVDPDDLAARWSERFGKLAVSPERIAELYGAHIEDVIAVLNRDRRFAPTAPAVASTPHSTWLLADLSTAEVEHAPDPTWPTQADADLDDISDALATGNTPDCVQAARYLRDADL